MVASLVNPHDVLFYPKTYESAGYDDSWLQGEIEPPATVDEDLSTKPTVQAQFRKIFNLSGPIPTRKMKRNYLNFYGNLMKASDAYLVQILDTLEANGLLDNTLVIATADHGEMGTSHGGMRQKNFNVYEESTRVPLVYSNPRLFKKAQTNSSLVSHVDFLPDAGQPRRRAGRGPRLPGRESTTRRRSSAARRASRRRTTPCSPTTTTSPVRPAGRTPSRPNHIVSIRERRYKLARYYDADGKVPDQWEMYDLKLDPLERTNLAYEDYERSPHQERQYRRLRRKLAKVQRQRLQPLAA